MYGKLFESMYDGTLVEDWRALITFQQMIVLCDPDGIVDVTPAALSRRTGIPIEHIEKGIGILEGEDPYSRTPDSDGRRIVRLDDHRQWGWYIVNHKKYPSVVAPGTYQPDWENNADERDAYEDRVEQPRGWIESEALKSEQREPPICVVAQPEVKRSNQGQQGDAVRY